MELVIQINVNEASMSPLFAGGNATNLALDGQKENKGGGESGE